MDELTIPFLGPNAATWQYPFKSLLRAGARLAMGSDWSVSTANPLLEMRSRSTGSIRAPRAPSRPSCPRSG